MPPLPDPSEQEAVKAAATAANLASRVHQADLASRAMLSAALEHVHPVSGWDRSLDVATCVAGTQVKWQLEFAS